ncbi:MAG: hypothetical protein IJU95_08345, partial [Treponema sp.]|nr:hypothetical protein [Treponema sp.]
MPRRFNASFIIACLIPAFVIGILIMTSSFQDSLLLLGGRIVGKDMISSRWKDFFTEYGGKLVLVSVLLLLYLIRSSLDSDRLVKFDRAFLLVVFASWLVLAVVSVFLHEPWRDEVHVWNIARSMNLAQIFHEMRYEGHFVAWFYLMVPFARLGFPPMTLNIISMLIMGMCAAILLFRSPFSIYAKTAFVFTLPMLYYYSVVSRCYCLFALCCFALADLFKKRREHPYLYAAVLALLANSHAYAEGMVAVLTLDAFIMDIVLPWKSLGQKDRRDRITALFIVCFFVLFAFMQVAPAFSSSPAIDSKRRFGTDAFFSACIGFFLALDLSTLSQFLLMIVAFFSVHYLARIRKTELLLILELSVLWMILFAAILYGASIPNRAWMFFFVLLFAFWQLDGRMA